MKKFIAILISVILSVSSFTVYAAEPQQDEAETYKEIIAQYFDELGCHFSNDLIGFYLVGKFGDSTLVNAFVGAPVEDEQYHQIGSYDVLSLCGFSPYRLALFVIKDSEVYTFEESYDKGIIDDATLDEMVEVIQNNPTDRFHYLRFNKQEDEETKALRKLFGKYLNELGYTNQIGCIVFENDDWFYFKRLKDFGEIN